MIVGQVDTRRNLLFPLTVRGFMGQELAITALLDTGFSDWLSLTDEQVATLGLLPSGVAESELHVVMILQVVWLGLGSCNLLMSKTGG